MTRNELLDLFTPIYDEFVQIAFGATDMKHPEIFNVVVDPTKDWKYNAISGLGAWEEVDEDSDEGLDHFVIGYEGTITPRKYRKYFYVTYEVNDQMEYAALKSKIVRAKALGRGAAARLELLAAGILINGFTTAGSDGLYTFYDSHYKNPEETGTTYDNLLSGAFSHDNLETAEQQIDAEFFDLDGLPMVTFAGKPKIVFPPALRGPVMRVLSERADERPATTTRDINVYSGKYQSTEWTWLSAALGGSDTAWYIIYPALDNLVMVKNTDAPHYASWIDNLRQRYYFDGWMYSYAGVKDWRGLFGSTGA
jgi:hypothetical protein